MKSKEESQPSFRSPAALGSLFFACPKKSNQKKGPSICPNQSHDRKEKGRVRDAGIGAGTAKRFIEEYLGADDLAAVVYVSGRQEAGQELTGNRRLLLEAIDRFQGRKIPSANVERPS